MLINVSSFFWSGIVEIVRNLDFQVFYGKKFEDRDKSEDKIT